MKIKFPILGQSNLFKYLPICLPVYLPICLSVYLPKCLSVYLPLCLLPSLLHPSSSSSFLPSFFYSSLFPIPFYYPSFLPSFFLPSFLSSFFLPSVLPISFFHFSLPAHIIYQIKHPEVVTELVLRGIFLVRKQEINWLYQGPGEALFLSFYFVLYLKILRVTYVSTVFHNF